MIKTRRTDIDFREVTTDAVILKDCEVLLVKRKIEPFSEMWALPGGHVNFDETVEEACIREVKEETNLDVRIGEIIGVFSDPERDPYQRISIAFKAESDDYSNLKPGDDAGEVKWFDLKNLPELAFDHLEILNRVAG